MRGVFRAVWQKALAAALWATICGCAPPVMTPDGQLVFAEPGGTRGASVLTANGVQFLDRTDPLPSAVVRKSVHEPFRAPTGFLLPASGVWTKTSTPVAVAGPGFFMTMRMSDAYLPSWGGEILMRVDIIVPPEAYPDIAESSRRTPIDLAVVIDGRGEHTAALIKAALDGAGQDDRISIVQTGPPTIVVPPLPGTHRTLLQAAAERIASKRAQRHAKQAPNLPEALRLSAALLSADAPRASRRNRSERRILVVSDGQGVANRAEGIKRQVAALTDRNIDVRGLGSSDKMSDSDLSALGRGALAGVSYADREAWAYETMSPPGDNVLDQVTLEISSTPAPAHIIESSGGIASVLPQGDQLHLGAMYVGESRTEVLRISVPAWVPGEPLELSVNAKYTITGSDTPRSAGAAIGFRYTNDVERLGNLRHGDVIAYASALAMVRKLDRTFVVGRELTPGGLAEIVDWQARSLDTLARQRGDVALAQQAEVLSSLLVALGGP